MYIIIGRKNDLARHKRMKHTLKKCEEYDFVTYENDGLANHMLRMHENDGVELYYQKKHK